MKPHLYDLSTLTELLEPMFRKLNTGEFVSAHLSGESTSFARFNESRIRQSGHIVDQALALRYQYQKNDSQSPCEQLVEFSLTGDRDQDRVRLAEQFEFLRKTTPALRPDPYATRPKSKANSFFQKSTPDRHPSFDEILRSSLGALTPFDSAGILVDGPVSRILIDSLGSEHVFETHSHFLDYSIFLDRERCLKGGIGGTHWDLAALAQQIEEKSKQSEILRRPFKTVKPGEYRTFIDTDGVVALLQTLAWGALSERAIRIGESPLSLVRNGRRQFSSRFTLSEDFELGLAPRFSERGELSPSRIALVDEGTLVSSLISGRTAQEFSIDHNGASTSETPRSLALSDGTLKKESVTEALGEGFYLSNLHYLNWSDRAGGRITGMTRYACFWVENGKWVAPIEQLRFDDSIFRIFGSELEDLTTPSLVLPHTDTYYRRATGGYQSPGILLKSFAFKS